uniref:Putative secreted peptide n=1 Tax=Anopheles braziliensis TaxID=58242 RepID=A0A2M3ZRP9_9DIPT
MSVRRRSATLLRLVLQLLLLLLLRCLHPLANSVSGHENALALLQEYKRKQKECKATLAMLRLVDFVFISPPADSRCICTCDIGNPNVTNEAYQRQPLIGEYLARAIVAILCVAAQAVGGVSVSASGLGPGCCSHSYYLANGLHQSVNCFCVRSDLSSLIVVCNIIVTTLISLLSLLAPSGFPDCKPHALDSSRYGPTVVAAC